MTSPLKWCRIVLSLILERFMFFLWFIYSLLCFMFFGYDCDEIGILFPVYYTCPNKIVRKLLQRPLFLFYVMWSILGIFSLSFLIRHGWKALLAPILLFWILSVLVSHSGGMSSAQSVLLLCNEWCFKEWRSPSSEMSGAPSFRSFEMNSAHFVLSVMEWAEK